MSTWRPRYDSPMHRRNKDAKSVFDIISTPEGESGDVRFRDVFREDRLTREEREEMGVCELAPDEILMKGLVVRCVRMGDRTAEEGEQDTIVRTKEGKQESGRKSEIPRKKFKPMPFSEDSDEKKKTSETRSAKVEKPRKKFKPVLVAEDDHLGKKNEKERSRKKFKPMLLAEEQRGEEKFDERNLRNNKEKSREKLKPMLTVEKSEPVKQRSPSDDCAIEDSESDSMEEIKAPVVVENETERQTKGRRSRRPWKKEATCGPWSNSCAVM